MECEHNQNHQEQSQLRNDVVREAYVWSVFNPMNDDDSNTDVVFVYPALNVPNFVDATQTLIDGNEFNWYECNSEEGHASCSTHDFSDGPSKFDNSPAHRFPIWDASYATSDADTDADGNALAFLNCAAGATCIFISFPEPVGNREVSVAYQYKQTIRIENEAGDGYDTYYGTEVVGHDGSTGSIVSVTEVGSDREWKTSLDGTPYKDFASNTVMHVCSKRGLCDYETGTCDCFNGYFDYRCGSIDTDPTSQIELEF
jgi:hypothetical protein